jgi:hypothetical protein
MTYTKQQKKEMRKDAYDTVNDIYKSLKEDFINQDILYKCLEEDSNNVHLRYFYRLLAFLKALKKGNYKLARYFHKILIENEEDLIDSAVFGESKKGNSENTRIVCDNCKEYSQGRKNLLLMCMKVDSRVGYWKLSK